MFRADGWRTVRAERSEEANEEKSEGWYADGETQTAQVVIAGKRHASRVGAAGCGGNLNRDDRRVPSEEGHDDMAAGDQAVQASKLPDAEADYQAAVAVPRPAIRVRMWRSARFICWSKRPTRRNSNS